MRMSRWLVLTIVVLVLVGWAVVALAEDPSSVDRVPGSGSVTRIRTFKVGPSAECGGDACGIGLVSMKVPTPDSERMAILVTVSFDYTTSAGDRGSIGVGFGGSDPLDPLWPRERPLSPSALPTSTTLVWSGKDLPAGEDAATVRVAVNVRSGGHTSASTRHMTVVVEMFPR
jgi:hypothetical protein